MNLNSLFHRIERNNRREWRRGLRVDSSGIFTIAFVKWRDCQAIYSYNWHKIHYAGTLTSRVIDPAKIVYKIYFFDIVRSYSPNNLKFFQVRKNLNHSFLRNSSPSFKTLTEIRCSVQSGVSFQRITPSQQEATAPNANLPANLHPSLTVNHRNFHTGNQIELVAFSLVRLRKLLLNTLNFLLCFISVVLKN